MLLLQESIADLGKLLSVFLNSENPESRLVATSEYLFNNSKYDLVDFIEKMLYKTDPCFKLMALFNYYEIKSDDIEVSFSWEFNNGIKSFINWETHSGLLIPSARHKSLRYDPRLVADELQNEALDRILNKNHTEKGIDLNELLLKIASRTGFLAFNIRAFRNLASDYSYDPNMREKANEIATALGNPFEYLSNANRKHWLYYVLAKKLQKEKDCKVRESFNYISQLLCQEENSITRRYYEKDKIAKKKGYKLEEIINQNGLNRIVNDYLNKYETRQDEIKIKRKKDLRTEREKTKKNKRRDSNG